MRRWHKIAIIVCAVIAALILAGLWYLRSRDFHDRIQAFIAAQVRQATGARVSFGQFQISWRPLAVDVRDVVVRGRESPARPPLATIAHVHAKIRLTHWFPPAIEVPEARVDRPVVDVYYLRRGGTDLPQPLVPPPPGQPAAEPIFNFGIRQLTIQHGELQVHDRRISLNARLTGLRLGLDYQGGHYRGTFAFTRGVARIDGRPPLRQSAQVRFTLWPNDLRIDALDWRGPGVALTAHGMVQDLGAPRVAAHYQVRVQLAQFGRWANVPVIAGQAQAAGEIRWSAAAWQTRGHLRCTGIGLRPPWPAVEGFGASGPYQAGDRGLRLPALQVSGGGGQGQIRLMVAQWRRFTLSGQLHGFHLEKLMATAAAMGVSRPPASLPPLAGTLAAKIQARGPIPPSRHLALTAQLRIVPPRLQPRRPRAAPSVAAPGRTAQGPAAAFPSAAPLPVAALLTAHAANGHWSVAIQRFQIAAPDLDLRASGQLTATTAQIAFSAAVPRLAQWRGRVAPSLARLAPQWFPARGAWPFAGALRLAGHLGGPLAQPQLAVALSLRDSRLGPLAADQLSLAAQVSPQALDLRRVEWRRGGQTVTASGTLGLRHFLPGGRSPVAIRVQGHGLQLAAIEALLARQAHVRIPAAAPRQGRLDFNLAVSGAVGQPRVAGPVALAGARVDDLPLTAASATIAASLGGIAAQDLRLQTGSARITGAASYDWRQQTFTASLRGAGISLAQIPALQSPRTRVAGEVAFAVDASGPVLHPRGSLRLTAERLEGGGESLGSLQAEASADGRRADLQATAGLPGGKVRLTAQLGETAPYPLTASAQFQDYDVDVLLRRFTTARPGGHSRISGQVTIQGPLQRPAALVAQANLGPIQLALGGGPGGRFVLRNQGLIHVALAHQILTLAPAHIVGPETNFTLAGTADLGASGRLRGAANGNVNLELLHQLDASVHSSGEITLAASLSGTLRQPEVAGSLSIHNASVAQEQLPVAFDDINGELRFTGQHVAIRRLTARTGGGQLAISGFAARTAQGFTVAVEARGQGLRVRYQGLSGAGNLDLHLDGNQRQILLSGDVELTQVALAPNFDFALFLANQRAAVSPPVPNSWLDRVHLQVHVVTGPSVGIALSTARVEFQADLHARGTLANPVLLGRISASQGEILFAGQTYKIAKAEVTFSNPFRIQPLLDVSLTTTVQQYHLTLNINGPADRLDITYRSDPPLTTSDIIALLATGQTQEASNVASAQSTTGFAGQGEQLLGRAFESLVSSRLQRIFGVTQIQFNPNAQGIGPTAQTTVTIAQQVRQNLKIIYTQNLTNSTEDIIRVDWALTPSFGVTVSRSQFGLYGLSLHFSQRAR